MGGSRSYERPLEEKCIYLVHYRDNTYVIIYLYINDMLIIGIE